MSESQQKHTIEINSFCCKQMHRKNQIFRKLLPFCCSLFQYPIIPCDKRHQHDSDS